jgi:hypothetical protein
MGSSGASEKVKTAKPNGLGIKTAAAQKAAAVRSHKQVESKNETK